MRVFSLLIGNPRQVYIGKQVMAKRLVIKGSLQPLGAFTIKMLIPYFYDQHFGIGKKQLFAVSGSFGLQLQLSFGYEQNIVLGVGGSHQR